MSTRRGMRSGPFSPGELPCGRPGGRGAVEGNGRSATASGPRGWGFAAAGGSLGDRRPAWAARLPAHGHDRARVL